MAGQDTGAPKDAVLLPIDTYAHIEGENRVSAIWEALFWTSVGVVSYIYFGYPALLWVSCRIKRKRPVPPADGFEPEVSLIIAAHNEEAAIARKIDNCLNLEYSGGKLEVIVASDGSTDRTNPIVEQYQRRHEQVILVATSHHVGKTAIQARAVPLARGEILVFSDAPAMLDGNAVRHLLRWFAYPEVGFVAGRSVQLQASKSMTTLGNSVYWCYETTLLQMESDLGILATASGWLFAIRSHLYEDVPLNMSEDFILPMHAVEEGYRVIYEPEARAADVGASVADDRFRSKVRIVSLDLRGLLHKRCLLNPSKFGAVSIALVSHKLVRWLIPAFLVLIFISSTFLLSNAFYAVALGVQSLFYVLAVLGLLAERTRRKIPAVYIPFYFCLLNVAAVVGIVQLVARKQVGRWKPDR